MKKLLVAAGILGLAFAGPAQLHSAEPRKPAAPASAPASASESEEAAEVATKPKRPLPYHGVVSKVNLTAKTFTITTKAGKDHVFTVTEKTQFLKDDAPAKFEDLKRNEAIRGSRLKLGENQWEALKVIIGAKEKAS